MRQNLTECSLRSSLAIAVVGLGLAASAVQAQSRMSAPDLLKYVNEIQACGVDRTVASAKYESASGNKIVVSCRDVTGFLPGAGTLGALSTLVLVGLAAGGGGSSSDTQ